MGRPRAGGAIARGRREGQWVGSSKGVKSLRACARCRVHQCRARRPRSPHRLGCVALALASIMPRSSVPIFSYADWPLLPTCPARGGGLGARRAGGVGGLGA